MKILGLFCVSLCFLVVFTYAQDGGRRMMIPTEMPYPTRTFNTTRRVTGGRPRVTAIPSRNNEEDNDDLENREPSRVTPGSRRIGEVTPGIFAEDEDDLGNDEIPNNTGGLRGVTVHRESMRGNTRPPGVTGRPVEVTTKRCPGCPVEISEDDENIQKYVRNATEMYKTTNEIPRDATIERVFDIKRQVINGLRYNFKIMYSYSMGPSGIKNMAICDVEVVLHHSFPKARINANPCKKPRSIPVPEGAVPVPEGAVPVPEGAAEEEIPDTLPEAPEKPVRGWI